MNTDTHHTPIALVTGGTRGLGRSTAVHLAQAGTDIILTGRSDTRAAAEAVEEIRGLGRKAQFLRLDLADSRSFAAFAQSVSSLLKVHWHRPHLDALVNNAGSGVHAAISETTEEQFDAMYHVHLKGTFFLTQALLPLIVDGGRIVNVSTCLTRFNFSGYAAYAAMKGGIEVLTRYLAAELGERRIAVNTMAPGAIATDFDGGLLRDDQAINALIVSRTALGRMGVPDDIGAAVAALLSPANRWMNGQRVEVSGGIML